MSMAPQSPDTDRFDRWARSYEDSWLQTLFFDRLHRAVLTRLASGPPPESLLDVGCATGRFLRQAGARYTDKRLQDAVVGGHHLVVGFQLSGIHRLTSLFPLCVQGSSSDSLTLARVTIASASHL
jgi:SAM-dependent methyltransferase